MADPLHDKSLTELAVLLSRGETTSFELVEGYLARIEALNPELSALIGTNPNALDDAAHSDRERAGGKSGPLSGLPIVIKDNIETSDPLPTTAGSHALAANVTLRDADLVAKLRAAGAIVLGKANLSEWANFRSTRSSSGWSGVGGQVRNPHDPLRSPCGSSSGSAVAVAAGMAAAAIGTETNGSIICPSSTNGVVGLKPSVGLVSQHGIVPISHSQDTAGPITRTVADAALMMDVLAPGREYSSALNGVDLSGLRLGVLTETSQFHADVTEVFNVAVARLGELGAEVVADLAYPKPPSGFRKMTLDVLLFEFKHDLNQYLNALPNACSDLTLAGLIAFNREHSEIEMPHFRQELFERSEAKAGIDSPEYRTALEMVQRVTREDGIDKLLAEHQLDAIVSVSGGPAWMIDWINGDARNGGGDSTYAAVAGYPHVTVPMGWVRGLPVGISFVASAGADAELLRIADAYQRNR